MFPSQGFTEIVFCAVTSNEQVKVRVTQGLRRNAECGASHESRRAGQGLQVQRRFQVEPRTFRGAPSHCGWMWVCVCVCVCVCVAYTLPCIHSQALPGFVGPGRRVWGHHTAPGTTQAKFTASEEMFENTSQCYWSFPRADMSTHPWGHCTTRRGVVWCGLGRWFRWLTPQKDFLRPCA